MEELKVLVRGEDTSTRSTQNRKRRASAITVRIQTRGSESTPLLSSQPGTHLARNRESQVAANWPFPEPVGSMLVVQDAIQPREGLVRAARLAGLEVLLVGTPEEAIQILTEKEFHIDLLLIIDHPSSSLPSAVLVRKSLEIRPSLQILMMMGSGRREEMRACYAAGASSIILPNSPEERITTFLKHSLSVSRETQRHALRHRERKDRHASDSPVRRGMRKVKHWVDAPSGSRRKRGLAAIAAAAFSLLIGVGLAWALDRSYRGGDQSEAMTDRLLERMNRPRNSTPTREGAILYGQNLEQIGLTREANEASRRYYQDHLQELRWQKDSRTIMPSEPVPTPTADRGLYFRK